MFQRPLQSCRYDHELVAIFVESWIRVLRPLKTDAREDKDRLMHVKSVFLQSPNVAVMWKLGDKAICTPSHDKTSPIFSVDQSQCVDQEPVRRSFT
ncbi:hypothetical protein TNCV_3024551 [Trichonephila clavipes]|nr:hypothetical protein TNCV_3024551 [Trichonephila clavipes]